jgi:hypothetical protein
VRVLRRAARQADAAPMDEDERDELGSAIVAHNEGATSSAVVLHEDKKYYPSASEVCR